jgi:hypothetical protein
MTDTSAHSAARETGVYATPDPTRVVKTIQPHVSSAVISCQYLTVGIRGIVVARYYDLLTTKNYVQGFNVIADYYRAVIVTS